MPLPKRTTEQLQLDLAAAAAVRQARKNIKRDLKEGRIDLERVSQSPRTAACRGWEPTNALGCSNGGTGATRNNTYRGGV